MSVYFKQPSICQGRKLLMADFKILNQMSLVTVLKCKIFDSKQLYDSTMDIIDNKLRSSESSFAILILILIPPSFHCSSLNYLPHLTFHHYFLKRWIDRTDSTITSLKRWIIRRLRIWAMTYAFSNVLSTQYYTQCYKELMFPGILWTFPHRNMLGLCCQHHFRNPCHSIMSSQS